MDTELMYVRLVEENLQTRKLTFVRACEEAYKHLHLIEDPGEVISIPDPSCVARHLPPGRTPNSEDIRRAIQACRQETRGITR